MLPLQPGAVLELRPVWLRGPTGQPSYVHEWSILTAACDLGLRIEYELLDMRRLASRVRLWLGQRDMSEPLKEVEANASPRKHLVERCEHDVTHACLHFPKERSAVGEKGAHGPA